MSAPQQIDHFELIRELGQGGMGKVYLARDQRLNRKVAIKVVTIEARTDAERSARREFLERLKREAEIAAALDHPGIVTIYHVGEHGGEPYVVMQFIDGPTLESLMHPAGRLDRAEALRILGEVAASLDYAHSMGVIHRDIKPPNIMLAGGKLVKVCDFGIAKFVASNRASSVLIGTQSYMSPERLQGNAQDGRNDQWSLAVMAYEVLTGRLPFGGENWLWQIVALPFPAPQQFDPSLDGRVTEVLSIALCKDPAGRYKTCSDFVADLTRAISAPLPAGATRANPKDGLTYVWIPPGTFTMGASPGDDEAYSDEEPAHQVTITRGFWIGQTPVTQEAWQRVMGNNPSHFKGPKLPVENVSWHDTQKYCEAVGMRLPTEAEWECAVRAGSTGSRYGRIDEIAWYGKNSGGMTHEVAGKQPNSWGLYDMLGNVWEWVADWYAAYPSGNITDPQGPSSGTSRALRGGCWGSDAGGARVSYRLRGGPAYCSVVLGFRCAGNSL